MGSSRHFFRCFGAVSFRLQPWQSASGIGQLLLKRPIVVSFILGLSAARRPPKCRTTRCWAMSTQIGRSAPTLVAVLQALHADYLLAAPGGPGVVLLRPWLAPLWPSRAAQAALRKLPCASCLPCKHPVLRRLDGRAEACVTASPRGLRASYRLGLRASERLGLRASSRLGLRASYRRRPRPA